MQRPNWTLHLTILGCLAVAVVAIDFLVALHPTLAYVHDGILSGVDLRWELIQFSWLFFALFGAASTAVLAVGSRLRAMRSWVAYPMGVAIIVFGVMAYRAYDNRTQTYEHTFAVGAKDEVVAPYPCRLETSVRADGHAGEVVNVEEWEWGRDERRLVITAFAPGTARFACNGASYVAHVRAPAAVTLTVPPTVGAGDRFQVVLVGRDAKGDELEIGQYGRIVWSFDGSVRADNPGHCEFPPWCGDPLPGSSWAKATRVGSARVSARFAGFLTEATCEVLATVDASGGD